MPLPSPLRPLFLVLLLGQGACDTPPAGPAVETTTGLVADTIAVPATSPFQSLAGGAILPDGRLALADPLAGRVWLLAGDGSPPSSIGSPGTGPGELAQSRGVLVEGDTLSVLSTGSLRLERFTLQGAHLGGAPVATDVVANPFELVAGTMALATTLGRDSSLARLVTLDGTIRQRYGVALAASPDNLNPAALKASIRNGEVPEVFRNITLPVAGPAGDVWLVLHTEGKVQRFDAAGSLQTEALLPEAEIEPMREEFFRANTDDSNPGALQAYLIATAGVADQDGIWLLLAQPASQPSVLLRISRDGQVGERLVVREGKGARLLLHDPRRGAFYLVNQESGTVVRVRREAGATP